MNEEDALPEGRCVRVDKPVFAKIQESEPCVCGIITKQLLTASATSEVSEEKQQHFERWKTIIKVGLANIF